MIVGHVLNSRDMVMKKAMVPALRELTFPLERCKNYIHTRIVTSAFKKLIRVTKQNVRVIKSIYV